MKRFFYQTVGVGLGMLLAQRRDGRTPSGRPGPVAVPDKQAPRRRDAAAGTSQKLSLLGYGKGTVSRFLQDDCMTIAASLAYYTVFSLPPLLLIIISVAGLAFGRAAVEGSIRQQIQGLIGSGAAGQVQTIIQHAGQHKTGGMIGAIVGFGALIFGATGAFVSLQDALNKIWHVKPDPHAGGIKVFLTKRLLSLSMVLVIGFLLLVSLALSAAIAALGGWAAHLLPAGFSTGLLHVLGTAVSFGITMLLFAAMFRFLPDVHLPWRHVWIGAIFTAVLFTVGKTVIGIYLGSSGAASAYGAAGSLVVIVLWIYYSSLIVLLGAEFTQTWGRAHGHIPQPAPGAIRYVEEERPAAPGEEHKKIDATA